LRPPGIEPGHTAWKAAIIAIRSQTRYSCTVDQMKSPLSFWLKKSNSIRIQFQFKLKVNEKLFWIDLNYKIKFKLRKQRSIKRFWISFEIYSKNWQRIWQTEINLFVLICFWNSKQVETKTKSNQNKNIWQNFDQINDCFE
jgi:hypothetical protein